MTFSFISTVECDVSPRFTRPVVSVSCSQQGHPSDGAVNRINTHPSPSHNTPLDCKSYVAYIRISARECTVQTLEITLVTICTTYFNIYKSSHLTHAVQLGISWVSHNKHWSFWYLQCGRIVFFVRWAQDFWTLFTLISWFNRTVRSVLAWCWSQLTWRHKGYLLNRCLFDIYEEV